MHTAFIKQLFLWSALAQTDSWPAPPEHSDISLFLIHPPSLSQERVMDGACLWSRCHLHDQSSHAETTQKAQSAQTAHNLSHEQLHKQEREWYKSV